MARITSPPLLVVIFTIYGIFLQLASASEIRGPPRVSQQVNGFRKGVVGRAIKMACPVTGLPPPLIMWTKDGVTIHSGWDRFRVRSEGLKINDMVVEDAGSYVCRATNGFGSVSINYTLTITDGTNDEDQRRDQDQPAARTTVETGLERPDSGTMPRFSEQNALLKTPKIMKPLNSSVRLKCKATGQPRPKVAWQKDGALMAVSKGRQTHQYTLKLSHLRAEDSGTYTCIVSNQYGQVNASYIVDVVDKIKRKPDLLGEHPVNTTVAFGGTTSFQCRVRSDIKPHIQWLKRVEPGTNLTGSASAGNNAALSQQVNSMIEMDGQRFVVLPASDVLPRPDGSYLNKLMISYARAEDAGMYICLGANIMGYSFKSAFLQVLPDPNLNLVDPTLHHTPRTHQVAEDTWSSLQQGLLIGIPVALVALFVLCATIWGLHRNRVQRQQRQLHRHHGPSMPQPQIPNPSLKNEINQRSNLYLGAGAANGANHYHYQHHHHPYSHQGNLHTMLDVEQCTPLTTQPSSQHSLHTTYTLPSRDNALNRYHDVHQSPCSFTDTLNSSGSVASSRAPMHHHMHQHTILHC